jgi:hypothetical protein
VVGAFCSASYWRPQPQARSRRRRRAESSTFICTPTLMTSDLARAFNNPITGELMVAARDVADHQAATFAAMAFGAAAVDSRDYFPVCRQLDVIWPRHGFK